MAAQPVDSRADAITIVLTSTDRAHTARFLKLDGTPTPVGRASKTEARGAIAAKDNALFECPVISREHAEFKVNYQAADEKDRVTIKDLGSLHGTYVNGKLVQKYIPFSLQDGDIIKFGTVVNRAFGETYQGVSVLFEKLKTLTNDKTSSGSTYSVPIATDDEVSDYGSDADSGYEPKSSSSNLTSPESKKSSGSQHKPIEIDQCPEVWDLTGEMPESVTPREPTAISTSKSVRPWEFSKSNTSHNAPAVSEPASARTWKDKAACADDAAFELQDVQPAQHTAADADGDSYLDDAFGSTYYDDEFDDYDDDDDQYDAADYDEASVASYHSRAISPELGDTIQPEIAPAAPTVTLQTTTAAEQRTRYDPVRGYQPCKSIPPRGLSYFPAPSRALATAPWLNDRDLSFITTPIDTQAGQAQKVATDPVVAAEKSSTPAQVAQASTNHNQVNAAGNPSNGGHPPFDRPSSKQPAILRTFKPTASSRLPTVQEPAHTFDSRWVAQPLLGMDDFPTPMMLSQLEAETNAEFEAHAKADADAALQALVSAVSPPGESTKTVTEKPAASSVVQKEHSTTADLKKRKAHESCTESVHTSKKPKQDVAEKVDAPSEPRHKKSVNRRSHRAKTSSLVHDLGKYTLGAALGVTGTFTLLASPLGGWLADWANAL